MEAVELEILKDFHLPPMRNTTLLITQRNYCKDGCQQINNASNTYLHSFSRVGMILGSSRTGFLLLLSKHGLPLILLLLLLPGSHFCRNW